MKKNIFAIFLIVLLISSFPSCESRSSRREKAIREMTKEGYTREEAESELDAIEVESSYRGGDRD